MTSANLCSLSLTSLSPVCTDREGERGGGPEQGQGGPTGPKPGRRDLFDVQVDVRADEKLKYQMFTVEGSAAGVFTCF